VEQVSNVVMPFDGVVWSVQACDGQHLSSLEPVCQIINPHRVWIEALLPERHAGRVHVGSLLKVRTPDGSLGWQARVESIRGVAAPSVQDPPMAAAAFVGTQRRRMAVRLAMESANPYGATECFGVGRTVKVSLAD
jgi:multidrug resistance efflux pump